MIVGGVHRPVCSVVKLIDFMHVKMKTVDNALVN